MTSLGLDGNGEIKQEVIITMKQKRWWHSARIGLIRCRMTWYVVCLLAWEESHFGRLCKRISGPFGQARYATCVLAYKWWVWIWIDKERMGRGIRCRLCPSVHPGLKFTHGWQQYSQGRMGTVAIISIKEHLLMRLAPLSIAMKFTLIC